MIAQSIIARFNRDGSYDVIMCRECGHETLVDNYRSPEAVQSLFGLGDIGVLGSSAEKSVALGGQEKAAERYGNHEMFFEAMKKIHAGGFSGPVYIWSERSSKWRWTMVPGDFFGVRES